MAKENDIVKITKKIALIEESNKGPLIKDLIEDLSKTPKNLKLIFKIADAYFVNNKHDEAFKILLKHYPENKDKVRSKLINFFDVLGLEHPLTALYRKKLSSMMFS
jgi:thioredoxin-like negative regulator of GroEL